MKKAYVVTDLGPGDGGKGGVVHRLAQLPSVHTVIKVGGAQGSHGVRNASGQAFAFSQFGCGTLEGVRTHISPRFVCDPITLLREAEALRFEAGVYNPFSLLTIDGRSLCNVPYYGIASRLKEMALRDAPRGTVGTGVGQAVRAAASRPDLALYARDMRNRRVYQEKIAAVREFVLADLAPLRGHKFLSADAALVAYEWALLDDPGFLTWVFEQFAALASQVTISGAWFCWNCSGGKFPWCPHRCLYWVSSAYQCLAHIASVY
jgi:adenylosuccinate synthase